jgi:hypothetical protein
MIKFILNIIYKITKKSKKIDVFYIKIYLILTEIIMYDTWFLEE